MCALEAPFNSGAGVLLQRIPDMYSKELWRLCRDMLEVRTGDRADLEAAMDNPLVAAAVSEVESGYAGNQPRVRLPEAPRERPRIVVHGTEKYSEMTKISLGSASDIILPGGEIVHFDHNTVKNETHIDEYHLKKCRYLSLDRSSVTCLEVSGLVNLRLLSLYHTRIGTLDTTHLVNLMYLHIGATPIRSIQTWSMPELQVLHATDSRLVSLDTACLANLKGLHIAWTAVGALNVGGLRSLERLDCKWTRIEKLDLTTITSLVIVMRSQDQEIKVGPNAFNLVSEL